MAPLGKTNLHKGPKAVRDKMNNVTADDPHHIKDRDRNLGQPMAWTPWVADSRADREKGSAFGRQATTQNEIPEDVRHDLIRKLSGIGGDDGQRSQGSQVVSQINRAASEASLQRPSQSAGGYASGRASEASFSQRGARTPPRGDWTPPRGDRAASQRGWQTPSRGDRTPPREARTPPRGERMQTRGDVTPTGGDRTPIRGDQPPSRIDRDTTPMREDRTPQRGNRTPTSAWKRVNDDDVASVASRTFTHSSIAGSDCSAAKVGQKEGWFLLDKYAEYLTTIEIEGKKEVTREMKAKRKEELDKQLEENKQLKQKEKEKIAQEEEKRQKDLNRQGQIQDDRQREKQLRQKKSKNEMLQHLHTARAEKEAERQRQIQHDLVLVEQTKKKLEEERATAQTKREQIKKTMEMNFQENVRARRKQERQQKEQRNADLAQMKAYEKMLAQKEEARLQTSKDQIMKQMEALDQQREAVVDKTEQEACKYLERAEAEQKEKNNKFFIEQQRQQEARKQKLKDASNHNYKMFQEALKKEEEARSRKSKEYEDMEKKAKDLKAEDQDKERRKREKHVENKQQLEQQMKCKDRGCKIGMSAAESKINRELLQLVRRTLSPEGRERDRDESPPVRQQALGFKVPGKF